MLMLFLSFLSQKKYPGEFFRPDVILSRSYLRNCCIRWSPLTRISFPIETNGKALAATGKFSSAIGKLMTGKTLATNGEEITDIMIGNDVLISYW